MQWGPTHWTRWALVGARSAPASARTLLRRILDQLRFQPAHPGMDFVLDFAKGRFRMAAPPLTDLCQNSFAQVSPVLFAGLVHGPPPLFSVPILSFSPTTVYPCAKK